MERHTYKVCQVLPRDPDQKMGRPRRVVVMAWDDLGDEDVEMLRKVQEPRLKPAQIAELDGKIVARSPEVEASDVADDDPVEEAPRPNILDPVGVAEHSARMMWESVRQHAVASAEVRDQITEMNRRALAQAKELDEALASRKQREPGPAINIDFHDLSNAFRVGATMFRDMKNAAEREPPK